MTDYQKDLITEFIYNLIKGNHHCNEQQYVEDRAELAVKLKQLRDGPNVYMGPISKKQTIESAMGISKSLRDSLRNDSLENYSDSKDAKDLFPGL